MTIRITCQGPTRTLLEYQFIPEQPSIRSDAYERTVPHHYYGSPSEAQGTRPSLSSGRSYLHNSEHFPSGYSIQTQPPTLSLLHQQGRHAHLSPASEEVDVAPQGSSHVKISVEGNFGSHPITGLENQFVSPETRVIHEEERLERKRKVSIVSATSFSFLFRGSGGWWAGGCCGWARVN